MCGPTRETGSAKLWSSGWPGGVTHTYTRCQLQLVSHVCRDAWKISQAAVLFSHHLICWKHTHNNKVRHARDQHLCSSHLFMPVLPEPHHLVHDTLQRGEQSGVQLPLHVHDPAAAPHWSGGTYRSRVRGPRVRLGPHWTGLLLSRCICRRRVGKREKEWVVERGVWQEEKTSKDKFYSFFKYKLTKTR